MAEMEGEQLAAEPGQSSVPLKIAPIPDGYRTASDGKYDVVSNFEADQEGLETAIDAKPKEDVSKAASELGKKGGKASAEKRKAEAKAEPKTDAGSDQDPAEVAAASDSEGLGKDDPGQEKPLGKPDKDPRARVAEATREAKEAREEARRAREDAQRAAWERDQYRQQVEQARNPKQEEAPKRDTSARPKLENFEDYDQYTEALTDWKVGEKFKEQEQRHAQAQQVQTWAKGAQDAMESFKTKLGEADQADEGWRDRVDDRLWEAFTPSWMVEANQPVTQVNVISDEIFGSELAPALLLYFTEQPEEFSRIARLRSPREISREMAKLEERLKPATSGTRPESSVSKAPLPFQPVKGAPHTGERPPGDESDYDSYRAYAKKQKQASR